MSQITIQAEDISIRFKDRLLFHIPHLKFGPQEAIYLTGANGVGKTTLLKILSGLQRPTTGKVNLQCNNWFTRLFKNNAKNGVIYMHQTPYMFDASVLDNVSYGLKFAIRGRQAQRSEAITALRMVGLEPLANVIMFFVCYYVFNLDALVSLFMGLTLSSLAIAVYMFKKRRRDISTRPLAAVHFDPKLVNFVKKSFTVM